jgi:hypothetical protein
VIGNESSQRASGRVLTFRKCRGQLGSHLKTLRYSLHYLTIRLTLSLVGSRHAVDPRLAPENSLQTEWNSGALFRMIRTEGTARRTRTVSCRGNLYKVVRSCFVPCSAGLETTPIFAYY